jgi:uncharacterized protein YndB with AHSA1/START domain
MKFLKRLGLAVLILGTLLLVGGWLLPSSFTVSRSIDINAPASKVYKLVASPKQWPNWSVWNRRDPAMKLSFSGPESGAGAKWAWVSASQGNGRMAFTAADAGQRVAFDLMFEDFGTLSHGELNLTPQGTGTRLVWSMNGDTGRNPLMHWMALMAPRMVGSDFDAGLANLKALAEQP